MSDYFDRANALTSLSIFTFAHSIGSLDLKNAKESFQLAQKLIIDDAEYVKESNELTKLLNDTSKKIIKEKLNNAFNILNPQKSR